MFCMNHDIRIFFPDFKSVQFTVEDGEKAESTDLLNLIAEHFGVPEETIQEVFALWLTSDLFEVQLKPHHVAAEVRNKWPLYLRKYTDATEEAIAVDEPLLVLRRNISLSIDTERMLERDYEKVVEMLYIDARDQYLCGRYLVDVETALDLAALQMAIDYEPYEGKEQDAVDLVHDKLEEFVPKHHLSKVRTFQLFGFQMLECRAGLEKQVVQNFKDVSRDEVYGNKNARRIAYLELLRKTPFYGAAFFDCQVERRSSFTLFEYSKRLFTGSTPLAKMNVTVSIQHNYISIVDTQKSEVLLTQYIGDCTWMDSDVDGDQALFLHFPDPAVIEKLILTDSLHEEAPPSKVIQIFSNQAMIMKALLEGLNEIAASDIGSATDLHMPSHPMTISPTEQGQPAAFSYNSSSSEADHSDANATYSDDSKTASLPSYERSDKNPSLSRVTLRSGLDQISVNRLSKLCLASLDPNGYCTEAHGTLKKLFIPVH